MKVIENDCVGCEYCIHCGATHAEYYYCDKCGDCFEPSELYCFEGEELCGDCLKEQFSTVEGTEGV